MKTEYKSATLRCLVCNRMGVDLHHINTRKSGGTDDGWNLMPLCRKHHTMVHTVGLMYLSNRVKAIKDWLFENGWEIDEFRNKWVRYQDEYL